jgi:uncharacterized RDD family membrane protein YckC
MSYPNALRRYVATVIDAVIVWLIVFFSVRLAGETDLDVVAAVVGIGAVVAYEPLCTVYGCTLGQVLMRFRVRTSQGLKRINIGQAYGRFAVKYLLGVISFLTMPARSDRRAIHDLASETIVIEAAADVA